ncbi:hypothetical protein E1263_10425 [Kribbella antibiotica]|uniref:Uncharacterized protein n=1 Tax=Kribbella antibiotica TaxID=190195 RepID=A0A4R4ZUD3_9ACTN|nr:hypothetical protein [Kribbella antibiotica]TDD60682.1 hypothetical protein E1263_10425 [Kribbella antibiotica]
MADLPPPQPVSGESRQADQAQLDKYAREQERRRAKAEEERKKSLIAEARRRASETSQRK